MKIEKKIILWIALSTALSYTFQAQNYDRQNVNLLGHWSNDTVLAEPKDGIKFQSTWGWEDKTKNRKYGIIGSTSGAYVIEVTDPANPVKRAYIRGHHSQCIWHEFKTYNNYLYIVSDDPGPNTLQIVDLSYLPDSVHIVHDADTIISRAHTIFIEGDKLYVGSPKSPKYVQAHMAVYSLADPTHPVVMRWLEQDFPASKDWIHDMYVRNDTIYASSSYGGMVIYKFNPVDSVLSLLASLTNYPDQGFNHSSYLTENGKTLIFTDEAPAGLGIKSVDVSDFNNITVLSTFRSSPGVTAHNPYIIGNDNLFVAYYQDGLQVFNIADPANPFRSGYFDTDTLYNVSNGYPQAYHGCWGAYIGFGAGLILATDMQNGLYMLDASAAVTGIHEKIKSKTEVSIYPNPMRDKTTIELITNDSENVFVLYDVLGNELKRISLSLTGKRSAAVEINREGLSSGIYFYKIFSRENNQSGAGKLIVE